jgi:hypothetical protein
MHVCAKYKHIKNCFSDVKIVTASESLFLFTYTIFVLLPSCFMMGGVAEDGV